MTKKELDRLSGAELLRDVVSNLNFTNESFNDRFTFLELIQIGRMLLLCEWDIFPDQWTERQIQDALRGITPRFDRNEHPIYPRGLHAKGCNDGNCINPPFTCAKLRKGG